MAVKRNTKKPKSTGHIKTSGIKRHRYGPIVVVLFLILIAAAGVVGYKVIKSFDDPILKKPDASTQDNTKPDEKQPDDKSSDEQNSDKGQAKKEETPARENEKSNPKYEGGDVNNENSLTGIVNYVGLSEDTVMIRVAIDQTVSRGTCDFTLTSPSGKVYTFSNSTTSGPSSTYCGLNKLFADLGGESGTWKISATIKSSSGKSGTIHGEGVL